MIKIKLSRMKYVILSISQILNLKTRNVNIYYRYERQIFVLVVVVSNQHNRLSKAIVE